MLSFQRLHLHCLKILPGAPRDCVGKQQCVGEPTSIRALRMVFIYFSPLCFVSQGARFAPLQGHVTQDVIGIQLSRNLLFLFFFFFF